MHSICDADPNNLCFLRCIFLCFEAVLRLKINLRKSEIVPGGDFWNSEELSASFGCNVAHLPLKGYP